MSLRRLRTIQRVASASTVWLVRSEFARKASLTMIACAAFSFLFYETFAVERYRKYGCHESYFVGQEECPPHLQPQTGSDGLMKVVIVVGASFFVLSFLPFLFLEWTFGANRMADVAANVLRYHFDSVFKEERPAPPDFEAYVRALGYRGKVSGKKLPRRSVEREMFWRRVLTCQLSAMYLEWTYAEPPRWKLWIRSLFLLASVAVPAAVLAEASPASRACVAAAGIFFHVAPLQSFVALLPFAAYWWATVACWILSHVLSLLLTVRTERTEELDAVRRSNFFDSEDMDDVVFLMYVAKR